MRLTQGPRHKSVRDLAGVFCSGVGVGTAGQDGEQGGEAEMPGHEWKLDDPWFPRKWPTRAAIIADGIARPPQVRVGSEARGVPPPKRCDSSPGW
jgi:hypothetical protein